MTRLADVLRLTGSTFLVTRRGYEPSGVSPGTVETNLPKRNPNAV